MTSVQQQQLATEVPQQLATDVQTMLAVFLCGAIGYLMTRLLKPRIIAYRYQYKKLETILEELGEGVTAASSPSASKRNAVVRKRTRKASASTPQESPPAAAVTTSEEISASEEVADAASSVTGVEESVELPAVVERDPEIDVKPVDASVSNREEKIMAKKALRKARKAQEAKADDADQVATQAEALVSGVTDAVAPVLQPTASAGVATDEPPHRVNADPSPECAAHEEEEEKAPVDSASVPSDDLEDTSCPSTCEMQVDKDSGHGKSESEDDQQRGEDSEAGVATGGESDAAQEERTTIKMDDSNEESETVEKEEDEDTSKEWAVYDSDEEKDLVAEFRQVSLSQVQYPAEDDTQEAALPWLIENEREIREAWDAMHGNETSASVDCAESIYAAPCGGSLTQEALGETSVWDAPHWRGSSKIALPPFVDGWMSSFDDLFAAQATAQADQILVPVLCSVPDPAATELGIELHKILSEVGYIGMSPVNASSGVDESTSLVVDAADEVSAN